MVKALRMPFTWPFQGLRGFPQVHNRGTTKQDHVIVKAALWRGFAFGLLFNTNTLESICSKIWS